MSEKDKIEQRRILNDALKESFLKMLELKKRLGQQIVTTDPNGNPILITVDEAERIICNYRSHDE